MISACPQFRISHRAIGAETPAGGVGQQVGQQAVTEQARLKRRQSRLREMDLQILAPAWGGLRGTHPHSRRLKPVVCRMEAHHAFLRADPDGAIGLLQVRVHIRVAGVDAITEGEMQPVLRLGMFAVRHVDTIGGSAPDPPTPVAAQEVRVRRSIAVLRIEMRDLPPARFPDEAAESDARPIADPDLAAPGRYGPNSRVEQSILRSDGLRALFSLATRYTAFLSDPHVSA